MKEKGRLLCKDCWTAHEDEGTLLARCEQCRETRRKKGQSDRKEPLKGRYVKNGDDFVCKDHRNQVLDVFCGSDACQTIDRKLSLRAVVGSSGIVAVIGDSGSGKTTLLYVLQEALKAGKVSPLQIRRAFNQSDEQLKKVVKSNRGTSRSDADDRNYAWELVAPADKGPWVVAFHDAAGGTWRNLGTTAAKPTPFLERFLRLIGSAIIVIDGGRLRPATNGSHDQAIQQAIEHELAIIDALAPRLRNRRQPMRIAVTLTKSDLLWERDGFELFRQDSGASETEIAEKVKSLLEDSGRRWLLDEIRTITDAVDYFAVSALGEGGAHGDVDAAKPERIIEPLLKVVGIEPAPSRT